VAARKPKKKSVFAKKLAGLGCASVITPAETLQNSHTRATSQRNAPPPTPSAAVTTSSSCCATRRKQLRIFDSVSLAAPWAPGTCVEAHTRCAKRITAVRCDSLSTRVRSSVGDHGAQAVARVERLDGLLGPGDALELVGDEMIERDLAADRLVDEHRHGVACLP
jgi:hypothetical protein